MREPNAQLNLAAPGSLSVRIAARVREEMFEHFMRRLQPRADERVLDIGVTADRSYESSNYYEALSPGKNRITACGLDDAQFLERQFPGVTFVPADATALPFSAGQFDLVHSSAVLEHVGSRARQRRMLEECLRVGRRAVCLTTPNRWFPVEFHTQLPFLHWLPTDVRRPLFQKLGYGFFAEESNLNLLSTGDMWTLCDDLEGWRFTVARQRLLGWTSNLILFAERC